ncbi:MAG: alpha/beta hydrolase-fold protein [Acholeplasma sp.]|nr:alpha/beta hydrolase-fold protein [Acholeplasma sp.]
MLKIEQIFSSVLNQTRTIRILLPDNYDNTKKYPVLYMHDAQNIFDDAIAFGNCGWKVSEVIKSLKGDSLIDDIIVVGIDNIEERFTDYSPWVHDSIIKRGVGCGGNGHLYADFIGLELKHYIDDNYATSKRYEDTYMVGSSMGAYITLYTGIKYKEYFSTLGIFSIASWFNEKALLDFIDGSIVNTKQRFFISVGTNETSDDTYKDFNEVYLKNSENIYDALSKKTNNIFYKVIEKGIHNEKTWREILPSFLLYANNTITSPINLVLDQFKTKRIVFLGEDHRIKEHLIFLKESLETLFLNDIRYLGMEFGANEDQEALNKLLTSKSFNREKGRKLLFNYNVTIPFKEYLDLYEEINRINNKYNPKKPMLIINLSYIFNWKEKLKPVTPKIRKTIFHKGNIEYFRANLIEEFINDTFNTKVLILTGTVHAFTNYKYYFVDADSINFMRKYQTNFGHLVYERFPTITNTILFNQPTMTWIQDELVPSKLGNGIIEALADKYQLYPAGINFAGIFGNIRDDSYYSIGYHHFNIGRLANGLILLKPLNQLHGATIEYEFVNHLSFQEIYNRYPDPHWHIPPKDITEYWELIKTYQKLDYDKIR